MADHHRWPEALLPSPIPRLPSLLCHQPNARDRGMSMDDQWTLTYRGLNADKEGLREAICTLGNGVFATRGAFEEATKDAIHYPGNYVAGGYNERVSEIAGRQVANEDLVNFPNWLWLRGRIDGGPWMQLWEMEVLDYVQHLHLKEGYLERRWVARDDEGRTTAVTSRRLVHMQHHHLAALQWKISAHNWSGTLEIESGLDASVINDNVKRYRQLESKHLDLVDRGTVAPEGIFLKVRTNRSGIELAQAARTRIIDASADELALRHRHLQPGDEQIAERFRLQMRPGRTVTLDKVVAQYSSRDRGIGECAKAARRAIHDVPGFDALLRSQRQCWKHLWHHSDITLTLNDDLLEDEEYHDQLILRLHIFHLLQSASQNTTGRDVGIPARGLHGEAYRGHIFWDELFILPFYILRFPTIARSTILYRYRRLDAARKRAHQMGLKGAIFPWQSGSDGYETTQTLHLNPMSGRWDPDHSHRQRHINSAVAYNIWTYYLATRDRSFIEEYGAEILLEIARFWAHLATYDPDDDRYDIHGVMGPDEYHEKYPHADAGGLSNNVYTNVTAAWSIHIALHALRRVISDDARQRLLDILAIDEPELRLMDHVSRRLRIAFHDGVLSQFEGYDRLQELDWEHYRNQYDNIERLDRILKAEGDSPDRYRVSKQADLTMLLYLFRIPTLLTIFERLDYSIDKEDLIRSVEYYRTRTSHGSTLSRVVFTTVVHCYDCDQGSRLFRRALESDLHDIQGGTTQEGIHLGAMAGTLDIVKRYYAGLSLTAEGLRFTPHLPERIDHIAFKILHHHRWFDIDVDHNQLRVAVDDATDEPVTIYVGDQPHVIEPGQAIEVQTDHPPILADAHQELDPHEELAPPIRLADNKKEAPPWPPGQTRRP